jgi:hypothetical protein
LKVNITPKASNKEAFYLEDAPEDSPLKKLVPDEVKLAQWRKFINEKYPLGDGSIYKHGIDFASVALEDIIDDHRFVKDVTFHDYLKKGKLAWFFIYRNLVTATTIDLKSCISALCTSERTNKLIKKHRDLIVPLPEDRERGHYANVFAPDDRLNEQMKRLPHVFEKRYGIKTNTLHKKGQLEPEYESRLHRILYTEHGKIE